MRQHQFRVGDGKFPIWLRLIARGLPGSRCGSGITLKEAGIIRPHLLHRRLPGETPETLKETGEFAAGSRVSLRLSLPAPFSAGTTVRRGG